MVSDVDDTQLFNTAHPTLGFCTEGEAAGAYLGIFPTALPHEGNKWDAALSIPLPSEGLFRGDVFDLDPSRDSDRLTLKGWGVVPVPEPAASRGLYALFAGLLQNSPPSGGPGVTGRFASGRSLRLLISGLTDHPADLSMSDIKITSATLTTALDQIEQPIDQIAALLAAYGYSLAIVPIRAGRDRAASAAWGEYLDGNSGPLMNEETP